MDRTRLVKLSKRMSKVLRHDPGRVGLVLDPAGWVPVDLGLAPATPPDLRYHGTGVAAVASIRATGLHRGDRHHVHLSSDVDTARRVGARRGGPVAILVVDAATMARDGHAFYRSANG